MIARAARALRCTPQTIRNYLKRHPTLAQVVAEERELLVDTAELKLNAAVQRGEPWAVCFTLKCLAKSRGYIERQDRTGVHGESVLTAEKHNNVIVVDGNQEQYIARLRQIRDATCAALGGTAVPMAEHGLSTSGNDPA